MEAGETEWHTFALANAAEALEDFRRTIGYSLSGAGSSPRSLIWVLCPTRTLPAGAFSRPKAARCPRYSPLGESRFERSVARVQSTPKYQNGGDRGPPPVPPPSTCPGRTRPGLFSQPSEAGRESPEQGAARGLFVGGLGSDHSQRRSHHASAGALAIS